MRKKAENTGLKIKKLLDVFYIKPIRHLLNRETYYYAATGGANTVLDILLYFIFYHFVFHQQIADFGFVAISPHIAAFIFVFPITFTTGFLLAKYVTFTNSPLHGRKQLIRYAISVGGSILLNYILLKILVEEYHIYPTPAKMITTVIVVIYSFLIQRFFTFKTGKKQLAKAAVSAEKPKGL